MNFEQWEWSFAFLQLRRALTAAIVLRSWPALSGLNVRKMFASVASVETLAIMHAPVRSERKIEKMSVAIVKRRQLKVLGFFTQVVFKTGVWFGREVSGSPENDLDGLLWPIFLMHVELTKIHANITKGWFAQWSIRSENLRNLWFYYWSFQSQEYRQKSKVVVRRITQLYKEKQ